MTTPTAEKLAHETLEQALATNEGRKLLFRQLASYEEADSFEEWCKQWRCDPSDPAVAAHWDHLRMTYVVAWRELGDELFSRYVHLGHTGLRLGG